MAHEVGKTAKLPFSRQLLRRLTTDVYRMFFGASVSRMSRTLFVHTTESSTCSYKIEYGKLESERESIRLYCYSINFLLNRLAEFNLVMRLYVALSRIAYQRERRGRKRKKNTETLCSPIIQIIRRNYIANVASTTSKQLEIFKDCYNSRRDRL